MKHWISMVLRLFLGGVFLYASWDKIVHPQAFAEVIYNYHILPDALINIAALVLPVTELLVAVCLISGIWLQGSIFMATLLLAVFFGALLFNVARGLDIHCGCFSTDISPKEQISMVRYVLRDLVFLVAAIALLFQQYRESRAALRTLY